MALLEFENVTFQYAGNSKNVLSHINLKVHEGELVLVMGSSGSGKTTLLKHMKPAIKPIGELTGNVVYDGVFVGTTGGTDAAEKSVAIDVFNVGYVGQNPDNQIVTDKVWHELAFGLENMGLASSEIRKRTAETAEYFGISDWYRQEISKLSGGQKQILNLAAVMAMGPKLLVLDEPTGQLDPVAATHFIDTIIKLNRELGVTVVIAEHRTEQLFGVVDRVIMMDGGRIVCDEAPAKAAEVIRIRKNTSETNMLWLPAAARIYGEVATPDKLEIEGTCEKGICETVTNAIKSNECCPLTVRDGRRWLADKVKKSTGSDGKFISTSENGLVSASVDDYVKSNVESLSRNSHKDKYTKVAVNAKNLTFKYSRQGKVILDGLDLIVDKGEFFGILGGNGSGKTTFLKLLCGIRKCVVGKVVSDGRVVMLAQNPMAMFTEVSVEEELAQVMLDKSNQWARGLNREQKLAEVEAMLTEMEIAGVRKHNPYDISGGQQQKLALAKALLLKPDILLLDEPTKGIDPVFKKALGERLSRLACENAVTIIMVSHDVEFCAEYCSRCGLLFDGRIVSEGKTVRFFAENSYYTTAAARIATGLLKDCVTPKQVADCLVLK